jgi:hypothetical protein
MQRTGFSRDYYESSPYLRLNNKKYLKMIASVYLLQLISHEFCLEHAQQQLLTNPATSRKQTTALKYIAMSNY